MSQEQLQLLDDTFQIRKTVLETYSLSEGKLISTEVLVTHTNSFTLCKTLGLKFNENRYNKYQRKIYRLIANNYYRLEDAVLEVLGHKESK